MSVNLVTMAKNVSINVRCHFTDKTAENCVLINVHMENVIISQENVQNVIQVILVYFSFFRVGVQELHKNLIIVSLLFLQGIYFRYFHSSEIFMKSK